jgi:anti-sigma-K factor RskA
MTDDMSPDDMLAMEWALGVLDPRARAHAEERRATDPEFRAACDDWLERLAPLSDELAPAAPAPDLWSRIEAEIDRAERPAAFAATPEPARASWWNSLGLWRGLSGALAAAALAALVLPRDPAPPPAAPAPAAPGPLLSATLAPEAGGALLTAALDPARRAVVIAPVATPALDGRVPELWLIPADGTPRSLGLLSLGGTQRIEVPATILELVAEGAVLAVSLEPAGGSPTGQPTGPVVATGKLTRV